MSGTMTEANLAKSRANFQKQSDEDKWLQTIISDYCTANNICMATPNTYKLIKHIVGFYISKAEHKAEIKKARVEVADKAFNTEGE